MDALIPIPLDTIRRGYSELGQAVNVALRTQQGDAARLAVRRNDCLLFLQLVNLVSCFPSLHPSVLTGSLSSIPNSSHMMNVLPLKQACRP